MKKILLPVAVLLATIACQKEQETTYTQMCPVGLYTYDPPKIKAYRWVENTKRKDTISFNFGPADERVLMVKTDTFRMLHIGAQTQQSITLKPYGSVTQGFTSYYFLQDAVSSLIRSGNFLDQSRFSADTLVFEPVY